jgi:hypothetical protein
VLAHELLSDFGCIFVQIGDENLHHAREVLDERFGASNAVSTITFSKTSSATSELLPGVSDYLLLYAKDRGRFVTKYRQLYRDKEFGGVGASAYNRVALPDGTRRSLTAAENQTFRSGWLGPWGGNMDYNGLREGVTVYLPVFQEGALLFVGDGHALEGDGELNGDALETSMDVEFTVNLIRGQHIQGPRFEDNEFLMASGIGGSLQDALQQATTELARWLEHDYKLSANESNVVLGTSIRYDIAEVVDPQVHIVAKISKAVLAPLK